MSDSFRSNTFMHRNRRGLTLNKPAAHVAARSDGDAQVPGAIGNTDGNRPDTLEIAVEFELDLRSEDLQVLKELGAGNGGTVSKVKHASTGVIMARKIIRVDAKENVRRQIVRELQVGRDCNSPYVITFYGAFQNEARDIVLCMEYMDCGSLDRISKDFGPVRVNVLGKITQSILAGLVYLYESHRIMHRDIKPSNVLVNSRGSIKLCDFGVATETVNSVANTFVGTSNYMAPERIQGGAYSVTSDVWSVGLTVMELAIGRFPFDTNETAAGDRASAGPMGILDLLQTIVHEPAPKLPQSEAFPAILHDFIGKCLLKNPADRPTPKQLYDNDLFLQAAERTPVDIEEWAVSMMNRHNRNSYLAPPAPKALNRDGSRDSVIRHLPAQPPTQNNHDSSHDPVINHLPVHPSAQNHPSLNSSTNDNKHSCDPSSGSSGDTQSARTMSTPTSASGEIPVIATQSPPTTSRPNGIPAKSPPPPLSLEPLSLETHDRDMPNLHGSRSNRLDFRSRNNLPEPASAIEPASRPMFPPRMNSGNGTSAAASYTPRNGLQSATMPRRTAPPSTGPPSGPLPLPPREGEDERTSRSAGFGSPRKQR